MHLLHSALLFTAWLVTLAWVFKLVEATWGLPKVPNLLAPQYDVAPAGEPSIAVIVPARNEGASIGECLESLLRQDYGNLRIVAVDDRSNDRTGAIMDALAGGRLEVMHVAALPAGWLGKTHAIAIAARHAIATSAPEYLLFTDGDIVFQPDAIRRALAQTVASKADHFTLMPTTVAETSGEAMLLGFFQTMSLWAVRTWRVPDPEAKYDSMGVGAFNLIRTGVYQRLGGFDATPMEILEDMTMGRRVKGAGFRQGIATGPGMVCVHWAPGVRGLVNGLTKNMFALFRFQPLTMAAAAAGLILLCFGPIAFLAVGGMRLPAAIALAAVAGLYRLSSRTTRIPAVYAGLYPVSAALVIYSMIRSMVVTLWSGGVTWRGTFYPLADLRRS